MTPQKFDELVKDRMARCILTLCTKGAEYSRGDDRLWNFKRAAEKMGCTPAQALLGMKVKHDVSIDDMVAGLATGELPTKEVVAEKIGDSINYLLLLEGLIEEARAARTESVNDDEWRPVENSLGNICRRSDAS